MDTQLKELNKLEKLASNSSSAKGKSPCIQDSLDSLLRSLQEARECIQGGVSSRDTLMSLTNKVDSTRKDIDDRQKEIYNSLARLGKAMEKVRVLGLRYGSSVETSPYRNTPLLFPLISHYSPLLKQLQH